MSSTTKHRTGPAAEAGARLQRPAAEAGARPLDGLKPLLLDVAVPMGAYYLLSKGFGMSTMASLGWSSVLPALRTAWGLVRDRRINGLAALILFVNVVGLLLSTVTGDPRLMVAKESAGSGVVGIGVLISVIGGKPLMTTALKPWITKGAVLRTMAWDRLAAGDGGFARAERGFSLVWGAALLAEAAVRVVGAYTLPVDTMVWLGTVIMIVAVLVAMVLGGRLAAVPMERLIDREAEALARAAAPTASAGTPPATTPAPGAPAPGGHGAVTA